MLKNYSIPIIMWLVFESIAVILWQALDNIFYLFNFSYIGTSIAIGLFPVILQIIILHYEGDVTMQIVAPTDGIVFFAHNEPLVLENTVVFKVIRRLHK